MRTKSLQAQLAKAQAPRIAGAAAKLIAAGVSPRFAKIAAEYAAEDDRVFRALMCCVSGRWPRIMGPATVQDARYGQPAGETPWSRRAAVAMLKREIIAHHEAR